MHDWNLLGFYDDGIPAGSSVDGINVLGKIAALNDSPAINVLIAIADPAARQEIVASITNRQLLFPTLIHPNALRGSGANQFGRGCILTAGVVLTAGIALGDFTILNLATTIGHDVTTGAFTSIMPQCSISGNVKLGNGCFIGAGARILQGISLGDNCVVGAGAVVTKSFSAGARLVGIPARNEMGPA